MMPNILDDDDALTFEIGRVARADADLESILKQVWLELVGESLAKLAPPRGMRDLLEGCVVMVQELDLSTRVKASALEALRAARVAHEKRNQLVHEDWLYHAEVRRWEGTLRPTTGRSSTRWSIEDFRAEAERLVTSGFRLIAVLEYVKIANGARIELWDQWWEALLDGDFDTDGKGTFRMHDPTLQPNWRAGDVAN